MEIFQIFHSLTKTRHFDLTLLIYNRQAKKDLSSHCDQIVISLANLNKQRAAEKQQPQSITTTVTLSKVMKTIIPSPVLNAKKINEVAQVASSSVSHSASEGASSESIPFVDEGVADVDESRDGNLTSSGSVKSSPIEKQNGSYRKGECSINFNF